MRYAETHAGRLCQFFKRRSKTYCLFSLEKLTVLTARPGNIAHTPKQQAVDGKDYVVEQNLFPGVLGGAHRVTSQTYCNSSLR